MMFYQTQILLSILHHVLFSIRSIRCFESLLLRWVPTWVITTNRCGSALAEKAHQEKGFGRPKDLEGFVILWLFPRSAIGEIFVCSRIFVCKGS